MPPQPLRNVRRNIMPRFGTFVLSHRPRLTPLVMQTINAWSTIDAMLTQFVSEFLKSDFEVVMAMFNALAGNEPRRAAFRAAAKQALPRDDYFILEAILQVIRPSQQHRNDFAHHVWGIAGELPDALLLAPPEVIMEPLVNIKIESARRIDGEAASPYRTDLDTSRIMVYNERDLNDEFANACDAFGLVLRLHSLTSSLAPMRDSTRAELLSRPDVRQKYEKLLLNNQPIQTQPLPEPPEETSPGE